MGKVILPFYVNNEIVKITFGFSPCPNDTFMFDAIVNKRIDLKGYEFDVVLKDVEELNRLASTTHLDVTKLSFNAYTHLTESYQLLNSGSALGRKCGPLLVGLRTFSAKEVEASTIAIPGAQTTANLLLSHAYPKAQNRVEMLFSDIEEAVLTGQCDLGLLIHENRFTYHERGLVKIMDLGEHWEEKTQSPIPLGGIVVRRSLPETVKKDIDQIVKESVAYAFKHPMEAQPFIKANAQEMDPKVMYQHIQLYVNEYSRDLGKDGKKAIESLFSHVNKASVYANKDVPIYI
jgi:1,4-dihydroxy-6-naphthoate synthase